MMRIGGKSPTHSMTNESKLAQATYLSLTHASRSGSGFRWSEHCAGALRGNRESPARYARMLARPDAIVKVWPGTPPAQAAAGPLLTAIHPATSGSE